MYMYMFYSGVESTKYCPPNNSSFAHVPGTGAASLSSLLNDKYKRFGAMAAFDNFQQFQEHFCAFVNLFRKRPLGTIHILRNHVVGGLKISRNVHKRP